MSPAAFAGAVLLTLAATAIATLFLLRLCRWFAPGDVRAPLADLSEFERGDCRLTQITRGE